MDLERPRAAPIAAPYLLANALAASLPGLGIPELQQTLHRNELYIGQVVGVQQTFSFYRAEERDRAGDMPVDFYAELNTDNSVTVEGTLNSARLATASSAGNLSGRRAVYIIGTVTEWDGRGVVLRPAFAGIRSYVADEELAAFGMFQQRRVYPKEVDQFARAQRQQPPTPTEVAAMLTVPEQTIKKGFATILGEPFVPKDWGGERSDLYTSRLLVRGQQISSAWLLKGPSVPRPMTIAALGRRGDQIDRLFSEPADLLVLQHCHEIKPAVVNMMETYAFDVRRPRRFMILDGADTARILNGYGMLPSTVP
jgi:hypothetical protein